MTNQQPLVTGAGLNSFRKVFPGSTVYALAEIIDNSIQWRRLDQECEVKIVLVEHQDANRPNYRLTEVLIVDNGVGMSEEAIGTCLVFGGGSNHGTEEEGKLGKYGLGLPYSSCSVAPEYHVYSWQKGGPYRHTFRDHDKYAGSDPVFSESVDELDVLPAAFISTIPGIKNQESGTIIQWLRCDNLKIAQAKTLIRHINNSLGRIYRHFIGRGVNIEFLVYRKDNNEQYLQDKSLSDEIKILDPLFLMPNNVLPGKYADIATSEPWEKFGVNGEKTITFTEKLPSGNREHKFKIRCSIAKPEIQLPPGGGNGGGVEPGKTFYKNCVGISLVRAQREIKLAKFDFPLTWTETTQRWWGLEVQFEPISDDLLDVSANKLDARQFRYISSDDFAEMESYGATTSREELQTLLSKEIDLALKGMAKEISVRAKGARNGKKRKCPKCQKNEFLNGECASCGHKVTTCIEHKLEFINGVCPLCAKTPDLPLCLVHKVPKSEGVCPECGKKEIGELSDTEKRRLIKLIKEDYPEIADKSNLIDMALKYFVQSNQRYFIVFADLKNSSTFIQYDDFNKSPDAKGGDFTIIELNTQHAFFEEFIQPLLDSEESMGLTSLWLFLASWIETEKGDYSNSKTLSKFRERFGFSLNQVIESWHG